MNTAYPRNTRFKCVRCGICCGDTRKKTRHILLLEEEAQSIASAAKKPISEFAVKLKGKQPYTYEMKKSSEGGKCLFLTHRRCTMYSKRPLICRFYPFGLETNQTRKTFYFTTECPGVGKGTLMQDTDFQKLLRLANKRSTKSLGSGKVEG